MTIIQRMEIDMSATLRRRLLRYTGMAASTLAATVAMAAALPRAAWAQMACPPDGVSNPSLRVMTYNVQAQNGFGLVNPSSAYVMSDEARIGQIVERIRVDDPDVVVLQEVNKSDAKERFVNLLAEDVNFPSKRYPHYVRNVDAQGMSLNNSGLMLFSKFEIIANSGNIHVGTPPSPSDWGYSDTYVNGGLTDDSEHFNDANALIFGDVSFPDSLAAKGVVVVRLQNTCFAGGKPFTVAVTHTQASYADHDVWDQGLESWSRVQQFEDIKFALTSSMTSAQMASDRVFLLGDFNVNGILDTEGASLVSSMVLGNGSVNVPDNFSEWTFLFKGGVSGNNTPAPSGSFFACGPDACTFNKTTNPTGTYMKDGWGFGMPRTDQGQSSAGAAGSLSTIGLNEGERLDYVLHNTPVDDPLCLQYMKRGLEYVAKAQPGPPSDDTEKVEGVELSDHLPVLADFNRTAPRCSPFPLQTTNPNGPKELVWTLGGDPDIELSPTDPVNPDPDTQISFPGSMQWYRITQAGSYVIKSDAHVRAAVYHESNLSVEVSPVKACELDAGTEGRKCKFSMPNPPYYVRVYGADTNVNSVTPDRVFHGNYWINFHRCQCTDMNDDVCNIDPAMPDTEVWPSGLLGADDTMFFEFESEHATSGSVPQVVLTMSQQVGSGLSMSHNVLRSDATAVTATDQTTWIMNGGTFTRELAPAAGQLPGQNGLPQKFFYAVHREVPGTSFPMTVEFLTDLTYFEPKTIRCMEERTIIGDDDVWGHFVPDGDEAMTCGNTNPDCNFIAIMNTQTDSSPGTPLAIVAGHLFKSYTGDLRPQIFEDVLDTGDDFPFVRSPATVLSLSETTAKDENWSMIRYWEDAWYGGYWYDYHLWFRRTHKKPACTGLEEFCPAGTSCGPVTHRCE